MHVIYTYIYEIQKVHRCRSTHRQKPRDHMLMIPRLGIRFLFFLQFILILKKKRVPVVCTRIEETHPDSSETYLLRW